MPLGEPQPQVDAFVDTQGRIQSAGGQQRFLADHPGGIEDVVAEEGESNTRPRARTFCWKRLSVASPSVGKPRSSVNACAADGLWSNIAIYRASLSGNHRSSKSRKAMNGDRAMATACMRAAEAPVFTWRVHRIHGRAAWRFASNVGVSSV
jgi:hypothetical protein